MSTLPAGVTTYERVGSTGLRRPNRFLDPPLVAVVVVIGLVLALTGAVPIGTVALALVAGLLVPIASFVLPLVPRVVVVVGAVVAGLAYDASDGLLDILAVVYWLIAVFGGVLVLLGLLHWWQFRRRMATAKGAPASWRDPSGGADVGFVAAWDDGELDYEAVDPAPEVVLAALRALDGHDRTYVTVFRGKGRLDVGGDATGDMVVQQSDNRFLWHTVCDPTQPDPTEDKAARTSNRSRVVYGRESMLWHRYRLTRLPWAEQAMRLWLTSGQRDTSLPWWDSSANWAAPRPLLLKASDR